jgi:predicted nucleic acid-binding protein
MKVVVDSSAWIEHIHDRQSRLRPILEHEEPLLHPYVLGEIACGSLSHREQTLAALKPLPAPPVASPGEVLAFIELNQLMSRGIGYVDMHLLASTRLSRGARLLTFDRRLADAARELDLLYETAAH